jgi:membrane-associated PAP2 superfamily phosphatase
VPPSVVNPAATLRRDLLVAAAGALLLFAWEASGWDLAVSGWFGGPGGFPWRDRWLTDTLLHQGGRLLGWAALAVLVADLLVPIVDGPAHDERWRALLITLVALLAVPALKRISATSCPWDLAPFGGHVPYVPHWWFGVGDGGPGHCFPSGHAVSAFAFLGASITWRRSRPKLARAATVAIVGFGTLFGAAQLARGAHFVSHTLWSAWLCWLIAAVGAALPRRTATLASHAGTA